jgi:TPR repeat protein
MRHSIWFSTAAAAVVTLASVPAGASEWWYVNSGPGRVVFIDAQSIERHKDVASYWAMYVIRPGEPEVMTKSHRRVRCDKRRVETLEVLRFDEQGRKMGDGTSRSMPMQVVPPDSLGDAELRFACGDEGHRVANDLFPLAIDEVAFAEALIAQGNKPDDAHDLHEAMSVREVQTISSAPSEEGPASATQTAMPDVASSEVAVTSPPQGPDDDAAEIKQLEDACVGETVGSCAELGTRYAEGNGVDQDPVRAAAFYDKACTGGDGDSCTYLGIAYHAGKGVPSNAERATALFGRACELGGASDCANFGLALVKGEGVPKDVLRAFRYFDAACDAGNFASCSSLGAAYSLGAGVPANKQRARRMFEKACTGEDAGGCYNLGVVYDQGLGVRKDPKRAAALYTGACEHDDGSACGNLGTLVQNGSGVPKDAVRAADLFRKSCELDDADGCLNLGRAYNAGAGVGRNREQAAAAFRRALEIEPDRADARRALSDLMPD